MVEESITRQKARIDWINLGDGNTAFFHASVRQRQISSGLSSLVGNSGSSLLSFQDIEIEVLQFYSQLVGTNAGRTRAVDIQIMRSGTVFSHSERLQLIAPVQIQEIEDALQNIGNLKAPGIDGFNA